MAFPRQAVNVMHENNCIDDMPSMAETYPLMNEYWEDKRAELIKIEVPAYIMASYTNPIHTHGTFRGYREIASKEKWLRVHNSTEWVDFYKPENQEDLMKFFDYYLKDMDNDWEKTPRVRYLVLNPGHEDLVNIEDTRFPSDTVSYVKWYLNGEDGSLQREIPKMSSTTIIPVHEFAEPEYLSDGEIVEADIAIRPVGIRFEVKETISFIVAETVLLICRFLYCKFLCCKFLCCKFLDDRVKS